MNENATMFSVGVHYMRLLTDYAASHGLPLERLLASAGISPETMNDPNGRVPFADFARACEIAATLIGEPGFGVRLGASIQAGHLGSHGYALMSCTDAREMVQQSTRYSALTIDAGHNEFEQRGDEFVRYWRSNLPGGAPLGQLQDELHQATFVTLARVLGNRHDLSPNWVSFRHAKPADISAYEAVFRCPLRFNAPDTAIAFSASYMDLRLPHANAPLRRVMDDLCAQLLKQLGSSVEPAWLAIARRAVLESFKLGVPEPAAIAAAAGMSESELKDKLTEHGLSFRGFVDELRHALALGYSRDPSLGLVDIAYLLGFSEQSAFNRAFKRWTGMTPKQYRQLRA